MSHRLPSYIPFRPRFRAVPGSAGTILYYIYEDAHKPYELGVIYTTVWQLHVMKSVGGYFGGSIRNMLKWSLAYCVLTGPRVGGLVIKHSPLKGGSGTVETILNRHVDLLISLTGENHG